MTSGDKASEALDATVNTLVAKVVSQTETAHDSLSLQMSAFDELVKNQGTELVEKFARDSGTLGALITRHISEFDRTVKTFGGDIVDRMGQRTQDIARVSRRPMSTISTPASPPTAARSRLCSTSAWCSSRPRSANVSATSTPR